MPKLAANKSNFDVVVIGGGPGGLSAALWCDELGLETLLLEKQAELGGQLLWTFNEIKNHLGVEARTGRELRDIFLRQIENRGFYLRLGTDVRRVELEKKEITLSDGTAIAARAVIIATGIRRRRLHVEGEEEFAGKGIILSGQTARNAVAGKRVLIVGGGDAALENALLLAESAAEVTLVHRRRDFRARSEFLEPVRRHPQISLLTEAVVEAILGERQVEAVRLRSLADNRSRTLAVDAVLIRIGVEPNTELFRGQVKLDKNGYFEVGPRGETSLAGVFAVGDVADPLAPTVSGAIGAGATAAKTLSSLLNS